MKNLLLLILFSFIICLKCQPNSDTKKDDSGEEPPNPAVGFFFYQDAVNKLPGTYVKLRVLLYFLSGMKREMPITNGYKDLENYFEAFYTNRYYSCSYSRQFYFAEKIFLEAMYEIIKTSNDHKLSAKVRELKSLVNDYMAIGLNKVCHMSLKGKERSNIPKVYDDLGKNITNVKIEILSLLNSYLVNSLQSHLMIPDADMEKNAPSKMLEFILKEAKNYWEKKQFKALELGSLFFKIRRLYSLLVTTFRTEDFKEKWTTALGDYVLAYVELLALLKKQPPQVTIKPRSTDFFLAFDKLLEDIEKFSGDLFLPPSLKHPFLVLKSTITLFLISHSYPKKFPCTNKTEDNALNQMQTCSLLSQQQEIFLLANELIGAVKPEMFIPPDQQARFKEKRVKIIKTLTPQKSLKIFRRFRFSAAPPNTITPQQLVIKEIKEKICVNEVEMCLEALTNPRNRNDATYIIEALFPSFLESLVNLKKVGPITDVAICRSVEEQKILIKMGYSSPFVSSSGSLSVWVCKFCGGGFAITNISFVKEDIEEYKMDQNKYLHVFRVGPDHIMVVEKELIDPTALESDIKNKNILANIVFDDAEKDFWEKLGYIGTEFKFFLLFANWKPSKGYWDMKTYPKIYTRNRTLEDHTFNIITKGLNECMEKVVIRLKGKISMQDSFNDFVLWTYRGEPTKKPDEIQKELEKIGCHVAAIIDNIPNSHLRLIENEMMEYISKATSEKDERAMSINIINFPNVPVAIASKELYPELKISKAPLASAVNSDADLQEALCAEREPSCIYLDSNPRDFLKTIAATGVEFPAGNPELNYAKKMDKITPGDSATCQTIFEKLPKVGKSEADLLEAFSGSIDILKEAAKAGCEMAKVYSGEIQCDKKLTYLSGDFKSACLDSPDEAVLAKIPVQQRIPILKTFYFVARISPNKNSFTFNIKTYEKYGYYLPAGWISLPPLEIFEDTMPRKFYMDMLIFVKVDSFQYDFIGFPDNLDKEECGNVFKNWDRGFIIGKFNNDDIVAKFHTSLFYSISPKPLKFFVDTYDFGKKEPTKLKVWIPVNWQGNDLCTDDSPCTIFNLVKSIVYKHGVGFEETCDGNALPIFGTYYFEFITSPTPRDPMYMEVSAADAKAAAQNGYIPLSHENSFEVKHQGINLKIRIWVKPKVQISTPKMMICGSK